MGGGGSQKGDGIRHIWCTDIICTYLKLHIFILFKDERRYPGQANGPHGHQPQRQECKKWQERAEQQVQEAAVHALGGRGRGRRGD